MKIKSMVTLLFPKDSIPPGTVVDTKKLDISDEEAKVLIARAFAESAEGTKSVETTADAGVTITEALNKNAPNVKITSSSNGG